MIKTLKLNNKIKPHKNSIIDGYSYNFEIAEEHLPSYKIAIATLGNHYEYIVDAFHKKYPNPPFGWEDFLSFMKNDIGIEATVKCNKEEKINFDFAGTWKWDDKDKGAITIFVNDEHPDAKKKITIIHECIHAIQDLDQEFKEKLDNYPHPIKIRIADRIAEKTAIAVALPSKLAKVEKENGLHPYQIACKYGVSAELASYA